MQLSNVGLHYYLCPGLVQLYHPSCQTVFDHLIQEVHTIVATL